MTGVIERRRSAAAPWSRRLAAFSLVLGLLSGLGHRYGAIDTPSFLWLLAIIGGLAVAALVAAAAALLALWERGDKGGRESAAAALIALLVLLPFLVSGWRFFRYPPLVDVSTDLLKRPSLQLASAVRDGTMNPIEVATATNARLQVENYPEVNGRRYDAAPDVVATAILRLLEERGWPTKEDVAIASVGDMTIEATAYSPILGFPADISLRLTDEGQATYVDMRSASRYMRHDLGDNGRRVIEFLAALDAALRTPVEQAALQAGWKTPS